MRFGAVSDQVQPGAKPPEREDAQERVVDSPRPRIDPNARILVVEDEHELRELIAQWLETKGYVVSQAADGQDAVELLEAGLEPDVILLDLSLPRMSGREFLQWMRAQPAHENRHVIVASAYLDELPPLDADMSFQKPFRPDRLAAELERLTSAD
jgi:two-component system alkaline phosphatase synthesis response regulator PhoP